MRTLLKILIVFGLLMGLLGFGLMFLDSGSANDEAHKSESANKTAAQVAADAYQDDIAKFKREFPTLKKTIPNLRWFNHQVLYGKGADEVESVDLVTPFGPCISMTAGHAIYSLQFTEDFYDLKRPSKLLGNYSNRADAVQTAEEYCQQWYTTESKKAASPARTRPLWFTPDPEVVLLPDSTSENQRNSTDTSEQATPIETSNPVRPPAPIERKPPPQD